MAKKSAKSSKKPARKPRAESASIDRPFDPALRRKAAALASQYRIVIEADPEVGFLGTSQELPGVFADGPSPAECFNQTLEALTATVATMLEAGQTPPAPLAQQARTTQLNVRLSRQERATLESAARRQGFRGVSDFVRNSALNQAR